MSNRKFGPLNRLREGYGMLRADDVSLNSKVEMFTGSTIKNAIIRGGIVGGIAGVAVSKVGPEVAKAKMRTAGIAGVACLVGGYLSDHMVDNAKTGKEMDRLMMLSEILSFVGGVGVGALAGSTLATKLTGKLALPAAFNGDPEEDPIVMAAHNL
jgi:hypothetical protein